MYLTLLLFDRSRNGGFQARISGGEERCNRIAEIVDHRLPLPVIMSLALANDEPAARQAGDVEDRQEEMRIEGAAQHQVEQDPGCPAVAIGKGVDRSDAAISDD